MTDPAWFFSSLAQSSAAIIGFIIAFRAILYQLNRRNREEKTEKLRQELIEYREEYSEVLGSAALMLKNTVPDVTYNRELEEPERVINPPDHPVSTNVVEALYTISMLIDEINASEHEEKHYLLSADEFETINEAFSELDSIFGTLSHDEFDAEMAEITGNPESEIWEAPILGGFDTETVHAEDDIAYTFAGQIQLWLDERRPESVSTVGNSLSSIHSVLTSAKLDFQELDMLRSRTIVGFDPDVTEYLRSILLFLIVGVFIPLGFLTNPTIPELYLAGITLYIIEIILLLGTAIISTFLILNLVQDV